MDYIIQFDSREQYDCNCNCTGKSFAKSFNENTTLKEVADWCKQTAGTWFDDYNLLTNPQILGITKKL